MLLNPLKYPKLNKFFITVINVAIGAENKIYFTFDENPSFRTHIGKKIYFTYDNILYNGRFGYSIAGNGTTKNYYIVISSESATTIAAGILTTNKIAVYDTFSIIDDNELATFQDIADYFISNGGNFEISSGKIFEIYDENSKDGLLSIFDKTKLDSIPFFVKSNNITLNQSYLELVNYKVDLTSNKPNKKQKIFLRDSENNILEAEISFINDNVILSGAATTGGVLFKINHCSLDILKQIEFKFTRLTYTSGTFIKVEIKLVQEISKDFEVYLSLNSLENLLLPSTTILNSSVITFNSSVSPISTSFKVDKYLLEINPVSQKRLNFVSDITVSLSGGKYLGKYASGQVIPSAGQTPEQVMKLIAKESLAPSITLTSSSTVAFNQRTAVSNALAFSKTINTLGLTNTDCTVSLDWKRAAAGDRLTTGWTNLSTDISLTTFTHAAGIDATINNTLSYIYRYTVTDTDGGTATLYKEVTPAAYAIPVLSLYLVKDSSGSVDNLSRELGNVSSVISGTITRQSANCGMVSYTLERNVNNAGWFAVTAHTDKTTDSVGTTISDLTTAFNFSLTDTDASLQASTVAYRVVIKDKSGTGGANATNNLVSKSITFAYKSVLGYSAGLTGSDQTIIDALLLLVNPSFTNVKGRTISGVSASSTTYTYYCYCAAAGDCTALTVSGSPGQLGAFTKQLDVTGTNSYGAAVTYRIYKSNAKLAFTGDTLAWT